jgi:hypothetical protein
MEIIRNEENLTPPCPELTAFFKEYHGPEELAGELEDIQGVLIEHAGVNELSINKLPNRYYTLQILKEFFRNLKEKYS